MIEDLKPYPAMKESGVPWLGSVPKDWHIFQARDIGSFLKGVGGTKEDAAPEGVPCVRYGELYTTYTFSIRASRTFVSSERAASYTPIQYGDVLFAASGETIEEIGKSAVNLMQTPAVCGGDVIVLRPQMAIHAPFLGYAADSLPATNQKATMGRGTTVKHIYPDELKRLALPLPSLNEQIAIARFLDWATRRLEKIVLTKRKMIALLNEQKQSMIHRAVTRGLDTSVAVKDSGVPWIGKTRANWHVAPLRGVLVERKEKNCPVKTANVLSLSLHTGVIPYGDKGPGGNKAKEDLSAYMLAYPGDIVLNSMNVVVGSVGLSKYFGAVSPVYYVLHPRYSYDLVEFFDAVFQDGSFQRSLFGLGNGIMVIQSKSSGKLNTIRMRIPMTKLRQVQLPYPEPREQAVVVEQIALAKSQFDGAINASLRELDRIREYSTRLIADVVTGKLDVRESAERLPIEDFSVAIPDKAYSITESEDRQFDAQIEEIAEETEEQ